jgi:hypothetical protein
MRHLPITGIVSSGAVAGSAFEDAVLALSPVAAYLFRDANFSSQITDSSGNGYHMAKQIATAARGAALRTTHPGGLVVPSISNWTVDGIKYQNNSGGLDVPVGGAGSASVVLGLQINSLPSNAFTLFAVGDDGSIGSHILTAYVTAAGALAFREDHSGGSSNNSDGSPVTGEPVIYTNRFHYTVAPEKLLDRGIKASDSEIVGSGSLSTSGFSDENRASTIGGRQGSGTSGFGTYVIDHISVFVPSLSVAQLDTLRAAYRAEIP